MNRFLVTSTLLLFLVFAGCATPPKIVGKWKVQPSYETDDIEFVQIFKDGTFLMTGSEDDTSMAFTWSKVGDQLLVDFPDFQAPIKLPHKNTMLLQWTKGDDHEVLVFHRE